MSMEQDLTLRSTVSATREQVSCEVDEEIVVLSFRTAAYYGLNPVAATAWSHMQEPITVERLRDLLLAEFSGVTVDRCAAELTTLLKEMISLELVEVRD